MLNFLKLLSPLELPSILKVWSRIKQLTVVIYGKNHGVFWVADLIRFISSKWARAELSRRKSQLESKYFTSPATSLTRALMHGSYWTSRENTLDTIMLCNT